MNVLIVEDEINAFEYLERMISKLRPSFTITKHLDSVEDTINWLTSNQAPDLIFLDIQLSDGISFEIFSHIEVGSPIIFTTAYDQFALKAFKFNSVDYLLKPINEEDLLGAITKFESGNKVPPLKAQLSELLDTVKPQKKNRFLVKRGNHFEFINANHISYINSDDSLTFLYTNENIRHLYAKTIQDLALSLDKKQFFQINRKQIININHIKKIHPFLNQRLKVELNVDASIDFIVSRSKMTEFKDWVDS
jgi:DNA-binding LytR/AlgR family response regulator